MFTIAHAGFDGLRSFYRGFVRDEAQDVFEYVLIIGILTVAVLVAVATPIGETLIDAIIRGVCNAINTIDGDADANFITGCDTITDDPPVA